MINVSLQSIVQAVDGKLISSNIAEQESIRISKVNTDTRLSCEQCLFVALKGPNFDAHEFLLEAAKQDATALMVESGAYEKLSDTVKQALKDTPCILVNNTRLALGRLAKLIREASNATFVGLTGSVGKTSVKEMLAEIFRQAGSILSTIGNLNNDIGVPLTLFRLESHHEYAIIEMGANHAGEIGYTSGLATPDVALINNVAAAHLEGFGDLQGIAQAKGEIYDGLKKDGIAIINNDDAFAAYWRERIRQPIKTFAMHNSADIMAVNLELKQHQVCFDLQVGSARYAVTLNVPGQHNVMNALAATACSIAAGLEIDLIVKGLESFSGVKGRLQVHRPSDQLTIIDDTYNANYTSFTAGVDVLIKQPGKTIVALGDMGELGEKAREYHQKAGLYAKQAGVDHLLTIGVLSQFAHQAFGEGGHHFTSQQELTNFIIKTIKQTKTAVLLKGSRSAHMEHVVEPLLQWSVNYFGETH